LILTEAAFKQKVKSKLHKDVYAWAPSDRLRRGVPDVWYSGPGGDLWTEYKYDETHKTIMPALTPHQRRWLNDRHAEGRNVCVIVGVSLKEGLIFVNGEWNGKKTRDEAVPLAQIVTFIESQVIGSGNDKTKSRRDHAKVLGQSADHQGGQLRSP
jgi:hypothetical protein